MELPSEEQVFLSLDDIIRLNRIKNKQSGSVKSFGSNKSNRSNYSNRSHGSRKSFHSGYSLRSNKSHYSTRGPILTNDEQPISAVVTNGFYRNNSGSRPRGGFNKLTRGHPSRSFSQRNKAPQQNYSLRYSPYLRVNRQCHNKSNWLPRSFDTNILNEEEDIPFDEITVSVPNEGAMKRNQLALTSHPFNNESSLRRSSRKSSVSSRNDWVQNKWGPKLDLEIQREISKHIESSDSVTKRLTQKELELCKPHAVTFLSINERFESYL